MVGKIEWMCAATVGEISAGEELFGRWEGGGHAATQARLLPAGGIFIQDVKLPGSMKVEWTASLVMGGRGHVLAKTPATLAPQMFSSASGAQGLPHASRYQATSLLLGIASIWATAEAKHVALDAKRQLKGLKSRHC